ncbi:MAG: glycosyltransferase family 1 protein [Candidatus Acidiferrum sp.]
MRIGINCLNLDPSFVGGLNTFTRGLLEGFIKTANGHQFRLYATSKNEHLFESLRNQKSFQVIALDDLTQTLRKGLCRASLLLFSEKVYESTSNLAFREIRKLMDQDADILYTPSTVLQCFNSRKPTVLSMHDIQHVHYPEFFSWPRRLSRRITYGLSAGHAHFFQASSEFSKRDLLRHFQCISADQITVIPEGVRVEEFSAPANIASVCDRYAIPERFLLYPAQLWLHKNHITLLRALKRIEIRLGLKIPLVLTGGKYSGASRVLSYIADQSMNYVHYLGRVPFADIVGLYQKAALLVMPSLHESNSLPVLEAAAAGTAVIASRIPPNEELSQVLRLNLFDPLDQDALEELLVLLWEDASGAAAQAIHNRKLISLYSWESAAKHYLQLFERAINA